MRKGWEIKKLGEVCNVIGGGTPSKAVAEFYKGEIPWATVRDMRSEIITNTEFRITSEAVTKSSTNIIPKGNVVIATRVGLGKVCLIENDTAINQDLRGIVPIKKSIAVKYLFWWLKSISQKIIDEGTGATVQGVKLPFIKSLPIPIPPPAEQQLILSILDEAFEAIDQAKANTEKNLQNAKELFQSELNSIFTNKGQGWVEKKLNEVCEVKDGTHDSPRYIPDGIPFVTQKNIRLEGLSFENTRFITQVDHEKFYKRSNVAFGDILISMIGANRGMACIVNDERNFSIKNVGLVKANKNINRNYLLYFLKSQRAVSYVKSFSKGGAQEFIGLTELRSFPIPIAPANDQQRIVNQLDTLSAETKQLEENYRKKLESMEELKKSILQKAFSGELTSPERVASDNDGCSPSTEETRSITSPAVRGVIQ